MNYNNKEAELQEKIRILTISELYIEEIKKTLSKIDENINIIEKISTDAKFKKIIKEFNDFSPYFTNLYNELIEYNTYLRQKEIKDNEIYKESLAKINKSLDEATEQISSVDI